MSEDPLKESVNRELRVRYGIREAKSSEGLKNPNVNKESTATAFRNDNEGETQKSQTDNENENRPEGDRIDNKNNNINNQERAWEDFGMLALKAAGLSSVIFGGVIFAFLAICFTERYPVAESLAEANMNTLPGSMIESVRFLSRMKSFGTSVLSAMIEANVAFAAVAAAIGAIAGAVVATVALMVSTSFRKLIRERGKTKETKDSDEKVGNMEAYNKLKENNENHNKEKNDIKVKENYVKTGNIEAIKESFAEVYQDTFLDSMTESGSFLSTVKSFGTHVLSVVTKAMVVVATAPVVIGAIVGEIVAAVALTIYTAFRKLLIRERNKTNQTKVNEEKVGNTEAYSKLKENTANHNTEKNDVKENYVKTGNLEANKELKANEEKNENNKLVKHEKKDNIKVLVSGANNLLSCEYKDYNRNVNEVTNSKESNKEKEDNIEAYNALNDSKVNDNAEKNVIKAKNNEAKDNVIYTEECINYNTLEDCASSTRLFECHKEKENITELDNELDIEVEAKKQAIEAKIQALEAKIQALETKKQAREAKKQALKVEVEAKKQALAVEFEAKKQALAVEFEAKKQTLYNEMNAYKERELKMELNWNDNTNSYRERRYEMGLNWNENKNLYKESEYNIELTCNKNKNAKKKKEKRKERVLLLA